MRTTIRPSGRLMLMIWRIRSRLVPALDQSSASTARLNANPLHQVDMQAGTGKTAEDYEHHRIAAGEQQQDRRPHPGKEFLERCAHQPQALRRLKRDERRAQADINREHATDPDDGTEYV